MTVTLVRLRPLVRANAAVMPDQPFVPLAICYGVVVAACQLSRIVEKFVLGNVDRQMPQTYKTDPVHSVLLTPLSVSMQFPFVRIVVLLLTLFSMMWSLVVFEDAHIWAFVWIVSVAFLSVALTTYCVWQHDVQSGVLAFVTLPASVLVLTQFVRNAQPGAGDAWVALLVLRLALTLGGFVTYPLLLRRASTKHQRYLPMFMALVEYGIVACDVATLCLVRQDAAA